MNLINLNLVLTVARFAWRHKFLVTFLIGVALVGIAPNNRSPVWSFGVVIALIGALPAAGLFLNPLEIFSRLFSRRPRDEHQRGSKIVSAQDLMRAVQKLEK
jgi:hypothetical protein